MTDETGAGASGLLVQLVPMFFFTVVLVVPFFRILRRAGRSGWWVLILLFPGFGWLILPWVIAFMRWERPPADLERVFR
jgi:uncharacterized membrane protein YhaH (DUF805 family)